MGYSTSGKEPTVLGKWLEMSQNVVWLGLYTGSIAKGTVAYVTSSKRHELTWKHISAEFHLQALYSGSIIIDTTEVFSCFEVELFIAQPCWFPLYQ